MNRKILVFCCVVALGCSAACSAAVADPVQTEVRISEYSPEEKEALPVAESTQDVSSSDKNQKTYRLSNLLDEASRTEVKTALSAVLHPANVEQFMEMAVHYNEDVKASSLHNGFAEMKLPVYDLEKLAGAWEEKHPDFPGTNCRINSFLLLQDDIQVGGGEADVTSLFIDHDAIDQKKIFVGTKRQAFDRLFSQVKTEATKDAHVHGQKMEEHLQNVHFSDKAAMVSLVIHDNLDGDKLFIGHAGVLVPFQDKFLFVEKLSFIEPYQALVFTKEDEVYDYLLVKFGHYFAEDTAKPFVMKNGKVVRFS